MDKRKAITFSYDDGVQQDKRLIAILDKYGLKCTFNLNSGRPGDKMAYERTVFNVTKTLQHHNIPQDEIKEVYKNHEVAAHSAHHPILTTLSDREILLEMGEDAKCLEKIVGKKVNGFAYPGGLCEYYNQRVKNIIKNNTQLYYGRTARSCYSFDLPTDLMIFHPTVSHREVQAREELARKFLDLNPDKPQLFYIWGHSYELDASEQAWREFEGFCQMLSGREDIFYGTNDEVFQYFGLK